MALFTLSVEKSGKVFEIPTADYDEYMRDAKGTESTRDVPDEKLSLKRIEQYIASKHKSAQ